MDTILVTIDGSEESNRLLDRAKEMAERCAYKLLLLHVSDTYRSDDPKIGIGGEWVPVVSTQSNITLAAMPARGGRPEADRASAHAEGILESGRARCAILGDRVETMAAEGNPAAVIVEVANRDPNIVLVMMQAQPSGCAPAEGLGDVAAKVARGLCKSVWFVR